MLPRDGKTVVIGVAVVVDVVDVVINVGRSVVDAASEVVVDVVELVPFALSTIGATETA